MRKILGNSIDHNLIEAKFPKYSDFLCTTCATGKLILRPSPLKMKVESLKFLERIQGDICGPIQPLSRPFKYFVVLIDTYTRWSHVCLLSTRNHVFAKFMTQVIRLEANYPKHRIQSDATESSPQAFNDYCMAHSVSDVHT
jgi:hypothetical protein